MFKNGVILTGGYFDYYCIFLISFHCFVDSVVFFTSSGISLQWSPKLLAGYLQCKVRLMLCMVLLYCIWRGFEAIVTLGAILIASFFS